MAERLDEDTKDELTEAFNRHAKKTPGRVAGGELQALMRYMGLIYQDGELMDKIKEVGGNPATGAVDLNQFLAMMAKGSGGEATEAELNLAFQVFDKDNSGLISTSELRYVLTGIGDKLDDEQVEAMLAMSDPSGTGALKYAPFVTEMLSKAQ